MLRVVTFVEIDSEYKVFLSHEVVYDKIILN